MFSVTVLPGQFLSEIAAEHGVSLEALEGSNPQFSRDWNLIFPGQSVSIPSGHSAVADTADTTPAHWSSPSSIASVTAPAGSFQACVISRESGGNPEAVNASSGAGGLYQFLPSTWAQLGFAREYPGGAQTAPVSVQDEAYAEAYASSGTSPWAPYDGC